MPDSTIAELARAFVRRRHVEVSRQTMGRALQRARRDGTSRISAQALRALLANREGYAQLLRGCVAAGTADAAKRLIRTTTVEIPQQFQERGHHYHSWLARKPLA